MVFGGRTDAAGAACTGCGRGCRFEPRPGARHASLRRACRHARGARGEARGAAPRRARARARSASCCSTSRPTRGMRARRRYLAVFESLHNTLHAMKREGYAVELPATVDDLRERLLQGNASRHGTLANVHARIGVDDHVRRERWLADIEAQWGPAPGRDQTDGRALFVLGERFGNVFVGRAAGLRLRRRPDAPAVREGLRADARVLRVLPLVARGLRRARGAALRHARRARVHAGQADRPLRRVLARPADRATCRTSTSTPRTTRRKARSRSAARPPRW